MTNAVVVDTDVVSYLFKSHPIAFQYLPDLKDRIPIISFMTLAELDRWVLDARWGETRRVQHGDGRTVFFSIGRPVQWL